jgi:transmembrane sensor
MDDSTIWQLVARKLSGAATLEEIRELEAFLRQDPELAYRVHVYSQYFENPSEEINRTVNAREHAWEATKQKLQQEFPGEFTGLPRQAKKSRSRASVIATILIVAIGVVIYLIARSAGKI